MNLESLGWLTYSASVSLPRDIEVETIARIGAENKGSYLLYAEQGELEGILPGKMLRQKNNPAEFPKVGDWVVFKKVSGENKGVIRNILPRKSKLSRTSVAKDRHAKKNDATEQIIATNIDIVFIVQGLDNDFNPRRIERYIAMAEVGGCSPVIILNKADIASDVEQKMTQVKTMTQHPVFAISALQGTGLEELKEMLIPGATVVFAGSSGAGKSTLVNSLIGTERQKTQDTREDDSKGRHTTTRREMIFLPDGAILIDTPGMREVGVWIDRDPKREDTAKKMIAKTKKQLKKNFYLEHEDFM